MSRYLWRLGHWCSHAGILWATSLWTASDLIVLENNCLKHEINPKIYCLPKYWFSITLAIDIKYNKAHSCSMWLSTKQKLPGFANWQTEKFLRSMRFTNEVALFIWSSVARGVKWVVSVWSCRSPIMLTILKSAIKNVKRSTITSSMCLMSSEYGRYIICIPGGSTWPLGLIISSWSLTITNKLSYHWNILLNYWSSFLLVQLKPLIEDAWNLHKMQQQICKSNDELYKLKTTKARSLQETNIQQALLQPVNRLFSYLVLDSVSPIPNVSIYFYMN